MSTKAITMWKNAQPRPWLWLDATSKENGLWLDATSEENGSKELTPV